MVEEGTLYFTNEGGVISKIPLAGGTPEVVYQEHLRDIFSGTLASDGSLLYRGGSDGSIWSIPIAGGESQLVVQPTPDVSVAKVFVDGADLYWVDTSHTGSHATVVKAPLAGGTPTSIYEADWMGGARSSQRDALRHRSS